MNHSRAVLARWSSGCARTASAPRRWLDANGTDLHRYGVSDDGAAETRRPLAEPPPSCLLGLDDDGAMPLARSVQPRGATGASPNAPSRHFCADRAARPPDRARPAFDRHVSAVAAGHRPAASAAPTAQVQLTMSAYLIGFAVAQIVYGPLSDRHGRTPGPARRDPVFSLATIACTLAPTIEMLIAARTLQAVGASGAIVVARAVVRDIYDGARIGRELSLMGAIMALAPIVAPLIGGVLQTAFGWRSNFVVVLCVGALAATSSSGACCRRRCGGARPSRCRSHRSCARIAVPRRAQLRRSPRHRHLLHGGPVRLDLRLLLRAAGHLSAFAVGFGLAFAVCSVGYHVGRACGRDCGAPDRATAPSVFGAAALAAGGLGMSSLSPSVGRRSFRSSATTIYLVGLGLVMPQAQAGALSPFPDRAGAASSLLGFSQQTCAAILGAIVGHTLGGSAWPIAAPMAVMGGVALVLWITTTRIGGKARPARSASAEQPVEQPAVERLTVGRQRTSGLFDACRRARRPAGRPSARR